MNFTDREWGVLSQLMDEAMELAGPELEQWLQGLPAACPVPKSVLRELLAGEAKETTQIFVNHWPGGLLQTIDKVAENAPELLAPGGRVGAYRLIRQIGRGGMGEVWLADRIDRLVKRPVALKLPHAGLHAREFAQFSHRERDILASLAHAGIARLYDAGLAEGGRPFMVLEFIEGVALDRYCDQRRLSLRSRLSLFVQVLDAVQYAHSNLVVHSDLKPSNVLVTREGEVKLLDFGIASLMQNEEANTAALGLPRATPLTLAYAAPEQIAGRRANTASDLYSLGIILCELLSGARPAAAGSDSPAVLEEPVMAAGSRRPSKMAIDESKAQARNSTPKRLAAALKGDLDDIISKATRANPELRYVSVDAFKSDIERHLAGEPVLAHRAGAWYRARKFVSRHWLAVTAAAAVSLALAAGLSFALREAHVAMQESQTASAVQEFIDDIFETNNREHADPVRARQTTARELLDIGARKIDRQVNGAPPAKEKMLSILANLYDGLGLEDEAVILGQKRVAVAKTAFGAKDSRVVEALVALGLIMHASRSVNQRESILLEAKRILDSTGDFTSLTRGRLLSALTEHYQSTNREVALQFGSQAIAVLRKLPPSDDLAGALYRQGLVYEFDADDVRAEPLLAEAVSVNRKMRGDFSPQMVFYASALGEANENLMYFRPAEENLLRAWRAARTFDGEEHVNTIETESRLGNFYGFIGRFPEGLAHLRHAMDVCLKIQGPGDPFFTPQIWFQYGGTLWASGRAEEGLEYISRAVENRRKNRPGTRYLGQMLELQALVWLEIGQYEDARRALDEALAISRKVGFKPGQDYVTAQLILASRSLRPQDAVAFIDEILGPIPKDRSLSRSLLRNLLSRSELALLYDPVTAAGLARRASDVIVSSPSRDYLKIWETQAGLDEGNARLQTHDPSGAQPLLERSAQLAAEIYDPVSPIIAATKVALASCYLDLGRRDNAVSLLSQADSIRAMHKQLPGPVEGRLRTLRQRLQALGR